MKVWGCLAASLHTLVIFHTCKIVWWVHWQPVGPGAGSPKVRPPPWVTDEITSRVRTLSPNSEWLGLFFHSFII